MVIPDIMEAPIRGAVWVEGGALPGMAGGRYTGVVPVHGELGPGIQPLKDVLQRRDTSSVMDLTGGSTLTQREWQPQGNWYGGFSMENRAGRDKLPCQSGGPVPRSNPWFPGRQGVECRLP